MIKKNIIFLAENLKHHHHIISIFAKREFSYFFQNLYKMVLLINGVPLEEAPRDVSAFISQYPHFKESASRLCSMKPETIGPHGLIYVFSREFAVTHPHDNKISVMGTDDITTSHIIVIKHSGM